MAIIVFILGVLAPFQAHAYPEFIGYKYASCLTCHFNSHGNGPLNDYGRALWSAEIAGRLWSGGQTDEQLGEASGFLGRKELPWWVRPGIKARELNYISNPGSSSPQTRNILMQAEASLAIFFDQGQKKAIVASYGFAPKPKRYELQPGSPDVNEWISREHYFRWQAKERVWLYAGMMDKVYGIRIINHTAYSRARTGVAQNDQAHGVTAHLIQPNWEFTVNGFLGNLNQEEKLRQKGLSVLYDREIKEAWRVGVSALASTNDYLGNQRLGVHSRTGLGYGSAILLETGLIQDTPKSGDSKTGYYLYSEAIQKIKRGYHLFVVGQAYKDRIDSNKADNFRGGFGLLAFPLARVEFRIELENGWTHASSADVSSDSWSLMSQLHLSL